MMMGSKQGPPRLDWWERLGLGCVFGFWMLWLVLALIVTNVPHEWRYHSLTPTLPLLPGETGQDAYNFPLLEAFLGNGFTFQILSVIVFFGFAIRRFALHQHGARGPF